MATSGAQPGNNNATKSKPWAEALTRIAKQKDESDPKEQRRKLDLLAAKTFEMALEGDMQAIKEIADRSDGRAHQSMDVTGDLKTSIFTINK